jgi:RHS repeat-associated protein
VRAGGKPNLVPIDPNGNQTSKTVGIDGNAVTTTYVYDTRNKLAEVHQGTSTLVQYQYDAEGRLLKKVGDATSGGDSGIRQYVYDQTSRLAEYNELGALKAKYDYGSDRLISLTRPDEGRRYFSLDGLRSVVNLTDDLGNEVASYHLDAWGNFRFPSELTQSANRFAFTGHVFDTETGLYYAKARFLDPKLGRFISQDSFLGEIDRPPSLHRYMFAGDNPATRIDLTGYDDADANALAKAFCGTGACGVNRGAEQVAAPITQRLEGVSNLVAPVSYLRNPKGEGVSLTRQRQYQLLDQAFDSRNSATTRVAAGAGAALLQPGAALNDIAHGLAGVPGELKGAYSHAKRAVQAESWLGAVTEGTQALEETMGAAETTIASILLVRGGAKVVEESRSAARSKVAPVEDAPRPTADYGADAAWEAYYRAHPEDMRSVGAAGAKPEPPVVTRKIRSDKLKYAPKERGRAPIGADDKPVELHHTDQDLGNASPRAEMTRTEHRGEGNFTENHPNTGQQPSTVDRAESSKQHREHWKREWDEGRFEDLPKRQ